MKQIENIKVTAAHEDGLVHDNNPFGLGRDQITTQVSFDGATIDQIASEAHLIGAGLSDFRLLAIHDYDAKQTYYQLSFCVHINGEEISSKTIRLSQQEGEEIERQAEILQKTEMLDDLRKGKARLSYYGNVYEYVGEQQPMGLIFQHLYDVSYSFTATEQELLENRNMEIFFPEPASRHKENYERGE